jgi:hypothetical protein
MRAVLSASSPLVFLHYYAVGLRLSTANTPTYCPPVQPACPPATPCSNPLPDKSSACLPALLQLVNLKVFLQNFENKKYCNADAHTGQFVTQRLTDDGWFAFTIPLSTFKCDYEGAMPYQIDRIDLQNTNVLHAAFCLGELKLLRG